jgi:hypothetical protein
VISFSSMSFGIASALSLRFSGSKKSCPERREETSDNVFPPGFGATAMITEANPKLQKGNGGVTACYAKFTPTPDLVSGLDAKIPKLLLRSQLESGANGRD